MVPRTGQPCCAALLQGTVARAWKKCSPPVSAARTASEVTRRDRAVAPADLFLATAGWDLWADYYASVPRTADRLAAWWTATAPGRAVLILDALSLREAPWLINGAANRATPCTPPQRPGPSCRPTQARLRTHWGSGNARCSKTTAPVALTGCRAPAPTRVD